MDEALRLIKVQRELIDELKETVRLLKDLRALDQTIIARLERENQSLKDDFESSMGINVLITEKDDLPSLN